MHSCRRWELPVDYCNDEGDEVAEVSAENDDDDYYYYCC